MDFPMSSKEKQIFSALSLFAQGFAQLVLAGIGTNDGTVNFVPAAFDLEDAAKYIGIGRTKLLEYRDAGRIKTTDVGGRPKYYRKHLESLLAELEKEQRD
jgi:hypothetical protein